jgi:hypothetical protein
MSSTVVPMQRVLHGAQSRHRDHFNRQASVPSTHFPTYFSWH